MESPGPPLTLLAGQDAVGVAGPSLGLWVLPDWTQFCGHSFLLLDFPDKNSVLMEEKDTEEPKKGDTNVSNTLPSVETQVSQAFFQAGSLI